MESEFIKFSTPDHEVKDLKDPVKISIKCKSCGEWVDLIVAHDDMIRFYMQDELVQNAFPYLTTDEREILMPTRLCGKCFDKLFEGHEEV